MDRNNLLIAALTLIADIPASIDRLSINWGELTSARHALRSVGTVPAAWHVINRTFAESSLFGRAAQGTAK